MNKLYLLKKFIAFPIFFYLITLMHSANAQSDTNGACGTEIIETTSGPVCGIVVDTSTGNNADAFFAIPFAESTAGVNRFSPPVPVEPMQDLFVADTPGTSCPQPVSFGFVQSEDCLHVNVWRPDSAVATSDLPVMVFIFGGAFIEGGAEQPLYDGSYIAANQDVIVVNMNYRIGVLGFLSTDELEGNYGFMDQQLALKWVNENIKNFGGDPDKVTIFGQSAGAMSVGLHLLSSPESKPLFRGAIMESNPFSLPFKTKEEGRNIGNVFQGMLDCKDAACLRELTFEELISEELFFEQVRPTVFTGLHYFLSWMPIIDGTIITKDPFKAFELGELDKPLILGTNRDEGELFEAIARLALGRKTKLNFSFPGYVSYLSSIFGLNFDEIESQYPGVIDGDNETVLASVLTDFIFLCANHHLAKLSSDNGTPVYIYRFEHLPSFNYLCLVECDEFVCHMAELPFVFHTAEISHQCKSLGRRKKQKFTDEEEVLSLSIIEFWTNFTKHLNPNGPDNNSVDVIWPLFTNENPEYMIFDTPALSIERDPFLPICNFWDEIGYFIKTPWIN